MAVHHYPTAFLVKTTLFSGQNERRDTNTRNRLSVKRAKAIAETYDLQIHDIKDMTDKFWQLHSDPILFRDIGSMTDLTIHYNPALGTLVDFGSHRPELQSLISETMKYNVQAHFMLTELGHGLDSVNLETRATLLPDGYFDLHTPNPRASKFMPPTIPIGIPSIAVVLARLYVGDEERGVRPFIVQINDGEKMCEGISAQRLPPRGDTDPLNHALTTFTHVKLPPESLLGSLDMPGSKRLQFLTSIRRVTVGSIIIAFLTISSLKLAAYTVGKYSQRRMVQAGAPQPTAIITFRTQQYPILLALADSFVFDALKKRLLPLFLDKNTDPNVFRAIAAICKNMMLQHHQSTIGQLISRCGAQGVFRHNGLTPAFNVIRGYAIGEGDTLVLSIRLASELLLKRYEIPDTSNPNSLLARHEAGLFDSARSLLSQMASHRSEDFNRLIIPQCQPMIEAIGHRMGYDAAISERLPDPIVKLFESNAVKADLAWYVEKGLLTQEGFREMEDEAVKGAYPILISWLESEGHAEMGMFAEAPIVSDTSWESFRQELEVYDGNAVPTYTDFPAKGIAKL